MPEGQALLELSTGPANRNASPLSRLLGALKTVANTVLNKFGKGEPPIQTELTTTLTPFVDIRRRRDEAFGEAFPSEQAFEEGIEAVVRSGQPA